MSRLALDDLLSMACLVRRSSWRDHSPGVRYGSLAFARRLRSRRTRFRRRDRALRVAGALAAGQTGARIVLGDMNATPWSGALNQLGRVAGLENSMKGRGVQASWPALLGPVGVPIDQFLSSAELAVIKRDTGPTLGSTHRSVWVTIGLRSGQ